MEFSTSILGVCSDAVYSKAMGYGRVVIFTAALAHFLDLDHTVWYMLHVFIWQ